MEAHFAILNNKPLFSHQTGYAKLAAQQKLQPAYIEEILIVREIRIFSLKQQFNIVQNQIELYFRVQKSLVITIG
ncbi:hypothetical protein ALO_09699 [Acetonema longum DSM 6540]|uniref:Uncharacterized protein n=1 Tax=Acetonema longum DSM 6540 TaxID=1009370 RepID=F7NIN7_9FIRM|nr:hypothetical protein ALO_09699 [Acetonema longum DSM 6540]